LIGNKVTILDPRYTPTGGLKMLPISDMKGIGFTGYDDDLRDPSKFFIVYDTGDNTTVAEGEAVPLDLFYSRATNFGDDYFLVDYVNSGTGEITQGFDWLEHDREQLSGEAANTCNNGGTYYYVIWNQWQEDELENVSESDAIFRRVMFIDDETTASTLPPVANLLYVSTYAADQSEDETITLVGSAKVFGETTVAQYRWMYNGEVLEGCEKQCNVPSRTLHPGWGEFSFDARDGNGWSKPVSVKILIAEELTKINLPIIKQ